MHWSSSIYLLHSTHQGNWISINFCLLKQSSFDNTVRILPWTQYFSIDLKTATVKVLRQKTNSDTCFQDDSHRYTPTHIHSKARCKITSFIWSENLQTIWQAWRFGCKIYFTLYWRSFPKSLLNIFSFICCSLYECKKESDENGGNQTGTKIEIRWFQRCDCNTGIEQQKQPNQCIRLDAITHLWFINCVIVVINNVMRCRNLLSTTSNVSSWQFVVLVQCARSYWHFFLHSSFLGIFVRSCMPSKSFICMRCIMCAYHFPLCLLVRCNDETQHKHTNTL